MLQNEYSCASSGGAKKHAFFLPSPVRAVDSVVRLVFNQWYAVFSGKIELYATKCFESSVVPGSSARLWMLIFFRGRPVWAVDSLEN